MSGEKRIYDPLYNYITLSLPDELAVVDTQPVQRLRRINQLGLSPIVYPAGNHSRFEHSLGVMHLAGEMAESLGLNDDEVEAYRLAGLLHDIGHPPYSHSLEPVMEERMGISHEEHTCRIIDQIEETLPVEGNWLKRIIQGESKYDIVAGVMDVDRLDYLNRDAYHTGLPYGVNSSETVIEFAKLHNDEIVFEGQARRALRQVLKARMNMSYSVYQHHTAKIVELMLQRSVERVLDHQDTTHTIWDVVEMDDYRLHTFLLDHNYITGNLYELIAHRKPFKRSVMVNGFDVSEEMMRTLANRTENARKLEREIAAEVGIESNNVLVDTPELPPAKRETVNIVGNRGEIVDLNSVSKFAESIEEAEWENTSFGIYTPKEHTEKVNKTAQKLLLPDI